MTARAAASTAGRSAPPRSWKTRCTKVKARRRALPISGGPVQVTARTNAASTRGTGSIRPNSRSGFSGTRSFSNTRSQKSREAGPTSIPDSSKVRARSTAAGSSARRESTACARAGGTDDATTPDATSNAASVFPAAVFLNRWYSRSADEPPRARRVMPCRLADIGGSIVRRRGECRFDPAGSAGKGHRPAIGNRVAASFRPIER